MVPSWLSPIVYYLSSQADVYGSVPTFTASSHRLRKHHLLLISAQLEALLSDKYTLIPLVMSTCTRHPQMRG